MNDFIFYFNFSFDDESEINYSFICSPSKLQKVDIIIQSEKYEKMVEVLESEYGVHDWSTFPSDMIEAIGYTTYEVEKEKSLELMEKWQTFFVEKFGKENVTDIVIVRSNFLDDFDMYEKTKKEINKKKLKLG